MKLVVESLNDVLKPKSSKEIQPAIEKAIIDTQNSFSIIADEIESLRDSDGWPLEMWEGRKNQVMNLLYQTFYELPDFLQDKFYEEFTKLNQEIDNLRY